MSGHVESLLEADHHSLGKLLVELDDELRSSNVSRAFNLLDIFWARLAVHIRAEHLQLFPALGSVDASRFSDHKLPTLATVQRVIAGLRSDHDFFMKELAALINEMRETGGPPAARIDEWRGRLSVVKRRLEEHNQIEEEEVYVWPTLLFDSETLAALHNRIQHELNNLPPRLQMAGEL